MHAQQLTFTSGDWTETETPPAAAAAATLVLAFGSSDSMRDGAYLPGLRERFQHANIVSCSTGGHVRGTRVLDDEVVATALVFDCTTVRAVQLPLVAADRSEEVGQALGKALSDPSLVHVLVFAEGLNVNGSGLARGLTAALASTVSVSGALAADGERFGQTLVGLDGDVRENSVVAVGLYGTRLEVATGSFGGWQSFGADRVITRSIGNVLYELDGEPAFTVYKELLGPLGYALPASGLMFPLKVRDVDGAGVIRTILGVNESEGSVTFAGDVPEGRLAKLVRTDLDQLVSGAGMAARQASATMARPQFVFAVSCIGRRMLLQQRTGEELQRLQAELGGNAPMAGLYSYGELASATRGAACELHNQTMTVTCFSERAPAQ